MLGCHGVNSCGDGVSKGGWGACAEGRGSKGMWDEPQSMSSDTQGMLKSISQGCVSNLNSATASLGAWVATCSVSCGILGWEMIVFSKCSCSAGPSPGEAELQEKQRAESCSFLGALDYKCTPGPLWERKRWVSGIGAGFIPQG